jgi:hypothetical protein
LKFFALALTKYDANKDETKPFKESKTMQIRIQNATNSWNEALLRNAPTTQSLNTSDLNNP